jgi:hypothetical protein
MADEARGYLNGSRSDVQPEAIKCARASLYEWSRYIVNLSPANILRWDGGKGERSGQLSWDMPDLGLRITSEIDLLHASPSPELVIEVDYKGGNKLYSVADVAASFQLSAVHPWLILHNYPHVNAVMVKVWNTRRNRVTYPVEIRREQLSEIAARIRSAALYWKQYHNSLPENAPTWPSLEKCSMCECAAICPAANRDMAQLVGDERGFVDQMVATEAALAKMKDLAKARVKQLERDLEGSGSNRFGTHKVKERSPTATLYQVKSTTEDEQESEEVA